MIIDWLEYERRNHVLAWLLVEAVGEFFPDGKGWPTKEEFDPSKLDVRLTLNGREVDLLKSMNNLEQQICNYQKDAKRAIIREYEEDLESTREQLVFARNTLDDLIKKLPE